MKTGQNLDEAISEHQHLVKVLRSTSHDDDRREAKKQAAELKTLRRQKVRDGLPAKPAPEPYPGVEPGDSLYIHHPERGPLAVKVHAQGRHGVTATDSEGNWHRAKWQNVLGAKQRLSQRLTLVDQGEDGAITEDESGQRRFLKIDREAREEPVKPLHKALATRRRPQRIKGLVLFFKTHIDGFTNAHGTFVPPHEDKRMPAKEPSEKGSGSPLIKPATPAEIEAFVADVLSNRSNNKGRLVLDVVSNAERLRIQAETGVNVGESSKILLPSTVIHATNEHPNLMPADWRHITDVLREFDGVFLSLDKGRNQEMRLAFIKLAGTPEAYGCVVDVAKGKKRGGPRLNVATFYRDHINMVLSLVRQSAAKKDEVDLFVARLSAQGRLPSDRLLRSTPPAP